MITQIQSTPPIQWDSYVYRPANKLVMTLTIFFIYIACFDVLDAVMSLLEALGVVNMNENADPGTGELVFLMGYACTALIYLCVILATIVVYCCWIHRANSNARALGAQEMQFTPGWCVGWWFIPFLNLVRPYQAVSELYRASDPDSADHWQSAPSPNIIGIWWMCWIISNIAENTALRLSLRDDPILVSIASWLSVASAPLSIAAALLALKIVRSIHQNQQRIAQAMAAVNADI